MKQVIAFLSIIFTVNQLSAQTDYTPIGTWSCINGDDTIEIYLKSDQINIAGTIQPILIGFHRYVKNGQTIENTLNLKNTVYTEKKFSIIIFNYKSTDVRNDGYIKDLISNTKHYMILKKLAPDIMSVRLTSMEGRHLVNGNGYTLPRNFQLSQ